MNGRRTVVQLPVAFVPWTVGGREVHTDRLARGLRDVGWDSHVVIHQDLSGREPLGTVRYGDTPVTVLPPIEGQLERSRIYRRLPESVPGFSDQLEEIKPDVLHFHDFSVGASLLHMREAHAAGVPTIVTFHSPGQSCLQTSLLLRGSEFCDGRIDRFRCTECRLCVAGMPRPLARQLASSDVARTASRMLSPLSRSLGRAATSRDMTDLFVDAWAEMIAGMSRLIVHGSWQEEILLLNGVDPRKIATIWNGIDTPHVDRKPDVPGAPLKIAFVGRCEEVKGPGVLIDAVKRLPPEVEVEVHLFGLYWDRPYGRGLMGKIEGDDRFSHPRPLAPEEVIPTLAEMDACVVPPLWVEVDPQIVLESFAAGTPVIGSAGYGVSERVKDGVDGLLFPPGDDAELARLIGSLALDRARVERLTAGVTSPRAIRDMALDVATVYEAALSEPQAEGLR